MAPTSSTDGVVDACVHQWTTDPGKMTDLVPEKWRQRLYIKSRIQDPVSGTIMPTLPWYHAYWNEDAPDHEAPDGAYTNSAEYRDPGALSEALADRGVERALLTGHVVNFLPAIPNPDYAAALASAYNTLLAEEWVADHDRLAGAVALPTKHPAAAVREVEAYADDPKMVAALAFGGGPMPLGHDYLWPIYGAVEDAGLPLVVHRSGNPTYRQTSMGLPQHYVTHDANLVQNHMTNVLSLVFQGVFDAHPDLHVVWAGEGVSWILHTLWRATRYYRNLEGEAPTLDREPIDYVGSNMSFVTYPLERLDGDYLAQLFDMVGVEQVMFGSGYPHWNADTLEALPELEEDTRELVIRGNAERVFGL